MKIRFSLFFLVYCVLSTVYCSGQSTIIDSLKNVLKVATHDTTRMAALNELAWELSDVNPDSSIAICVRTLKMSEALLSNAEPTSGMALAALIRKGSALHYLGVFYSDRGDYLSALERYQLAMNNWERALKHPMVITEKMKKRQSTTLGNMGNVNINLGNYTSSLKFYYQALAIDEGLDNKEGIARHYGNIGNIFMVSNDLNKAKEWYEKALAINREIGYDFGTASMLTNLGNVYIGKKQHKLALEYYFKALELDEKEQSNADISADLGNIGIVYKELGEYDKAIDYYNKALKISELLGDKNSIAAQTGNIGSMYLAQKQYEKGERFLLEALKIAGEIKAVELMTAEHEALSTLYEETHDFTRSLQHYRKFTQLKDSLFNDEKDKELTRQGLNYEFEKKEVALKAGQEKREAVQAEDKKRQYIFLALVSAIALAIGIIASIVFRSLRLTRKQKSIIEFQKELVEVKQREVLDSIHYAQRIQTSLLPTEKYIAKNLLRLNKKT